MKTKYRTIIEASVEYLQYYHEDYTKFLFFTINNSEWRFVPKPYWEKYFGRNEGEYDLNREDKYVCSKNQHINTFIKKYPDISEYWPWYVEEEKRLREKCLQEIEKFWKDEGKITYL